MLIQSRFLGVLVTCLASVAQADALMTPNEALSPMMASGLRDARACGRQDRDLCANREVECHRECTNLTTCGRTCCESYQGCLSSRDCEIRTPACPK